MTAKRQPRYAAFGKALRSAMAATGYTGVTLARETGYARSNISKARLGERLPTPARLAQLAEILDAPHLVVLARRRRERRCEECEATFEAMPTGKQMRFCRAACRRRWHGRNERASRAASVTDRMKSYARRQAHLRDRLAAVTGERNTILDAVAAYCWACSPEGLCWDSTSLLRPWSPLPLADERLRVA